MDETPNLKLPYLMAAQAQKHITHNEALQRLDAIVQLSLIDRDLAAPPGSPSEGDRYIVASGPSGAWAGYPGRVAQFIDGVWTFAEPKRGWAAWVEDEETLILYDGAAWQTLNDVLAATGLSLSLLGVNATADTTNRLSVTSAATLLNHAGSGHQLKINKANAAATAALLFQSGFSGRAEFGLAGDDDFHVKVSSDGSVFHEAIIVDRATGDVTLPRGYGRTQIDVITASGNWSKPAWAKHITAVAIGGGAGGGGGRRGAAASDRRGGGGGGAGGVATAKWLASEIGATLVCTIGVGGSGGAGATVDSTNGTAGGSGGQTYIDDGGVQILRATAAAGGAGGTNTTTSGGAGGGGILVSNGGGAGGNPTGSAGAYTTVGNAPAAGGGGGGITTGNVTGAGGLGGWGYIVGGTGRSSLRGNAGVVGGAGGAGADKAWQRGQGAGGGGGGSGDTAGTAVGGAGGAGGIPGGGGGGGGASTNGANAGAGGSGGRGEIWFICSG